MKNRGFSLIEMMIAMSAGMAIILIATAGFQAASKSMAVATTLSTENKVIGTGVLMIFDEADFWTSYDNEANPNGHLMRTSNPVSTSDPNNGNALIFGLPFSPFSTASPASASNRAVWDQGASGATRGFGRGWEDDESTWVISADNKLLYMTDSTMECGGGTDPTDVNQNGNHRFGWNALYGISQLPEQASTPVLIGHPSLSPGTIIQSPDFPAKPVYDYPTKIGNQSAYLNSFSTYRAGRHPAWIFNKIRGISNAIGWYGMCDYLPENSLFTYIRPYFAYSGSKFLTDTPLVQQGEYTDNGGRPLFWCYVREHLSEDKYGFEYGSGWSPSLNLFFDGYPYYDILGGIRESNSALQLPRTFDSLTDHLGFSLIPINNQLGLIDTKTCLAYIRMCAVSSASAAFAQKKLSSANQFDYVATDSTNPASYINSSDFFKRTTGTSNLSNIYPVDWPVVSATISHHLLRWKFTNECGILWFNPGNGSSSSLHFTLMGTTLRGARRQRGLDL